jgi:hypothetical protein
MAFTVRLEIVLLCPRLSPPPIASDPRSRFALPYFAAAKAVSAGICGAVSPLSAWLPPPSELLRPFITQRSTRPVAGLYPSVPSLACSTIRSCFFAACAMHPSTAHVVAPSMSILCAPLCPAQPDASRRVQGSRRNAPVEPHLPAPAARQKKERCSPALPQDDRWLRERSCGRWRSYASSLPRQPMR